MAETATIAAVAAQTTVSPFQKAVEMHLQVETADGEFMPVQDLVDESLPTIAAIGKRYEKKISDANGTTSYFVEDSKASKKDKFTFEVIKGIYDSKKEQADAAERKRKAQRNVELAKEQKEKAEAQLLTKMSPEQLQAYIDQQQAIAEGEDF